MNRQKIQFYKQLLAVMQKPAVFYDTLGQTTTEITTLYNTKYNDNKNTKEIAGGLLFLARKGAINKIKVNNVTRWALGPRELYDVINKT